jgi:hypothetical protein
MKNKIKLKYYIKKIFNNSMNLPGKIYDIDIWFYKEMRQFHNRFNTEYSWMVLTKETIYYTHWSNSIMYEFLNSDTDDIFNVVNKINIKSIQEYFNTKSLF